MTHNVAICLVALAPFNTQESLRVIHNASAIPTLEFKRVLGIISKMTSINKFPIKIVVLLILEAKVVCLFRIVRAQIPTRLV